MRTPGVVKRSISRIAQVAVFVQAQAKVVRTGCAAIRDKTG